MEDIKNETFDYIQRKYNPFQFLMNEIKELWNLNKEWEEYQKRKS